MKIRYAAGIAVLASLGLMIPSADAQQATLTINPSTVRQIQRQLNQRGYNSGPVDGNWGMRSQRAMKNFQQAQGLEATGEVDPETMSALGVRLNGAPMPQNQIARNEQPRPSTVRQVQRDLNRRGYSAGNVDGVWGPETRQALRNFQRTEGLTTTGRLDNQTLSALHGNSRR